MILIIVYFILFTFIYITFIIVYYIQITYMVIDELNIVHNYRVFFMNQNNTI